MNILLQLLQLQIFLRSTCVIFLHSISFSIQIFQTFFFHNFFFVTIILPFFDNTKQSLNVFPLPNQRPTFLFGYMIDRYPFQFIQGYAFPRFYEIYLESDFDFLRESTLWEDCLNLGYYRTGHHAPFWADSVNFLSYSGYHRKVLRKVLGYDPGYSTGGHVFQLVQIWKSINTSVVILISVN